MKASGSDPTTNDLCDVAGKSKLALAIRTKQATSSKGQSTHVMAITMLNASKVKSPSMVGLLFQSFVRALEGFNHVANSKTKMLDMPLIPLQR